MMTFVERPIAIADAADFAGRAGALCVRRLADGILYTSWHHVPDLGQAAAEFHARQPGLHLSAILDVSAADDRSAAWAGTVGPLTAWLAAA